MQIIVWTMTLLGICVATLILTAAGSIQSEKDPCLPEHHSIIDDFRRSTKYRSKASDRRLCDNSLSPGWYRFKINGTDADMPTKCVKVKRCGTAAPIWLSIPKEGMPIPGATKSGSACVTWAPRGERPECCPIKFPVEVKNCINFFVYKLTSTGGCDLAYCAEVPKKTCSTGQVYIRHLKKCIDYNVRTSKPSLQVSVSRKNAMITCTFRVLNKLIAMTSPTFYIAWYRKERGLSLIKSTFTRKTKDSIVIGEHAFSGDTVICSVEEIYQMRDKKSRKSRPYFIGIKLLRKKIVLREDRPVANVSLISTVPIVCDNNTHTCGITIRLSLQTPGDISPEITFEKCVIHFGMGWKCRKNICQEQTFQVAMAPNLKHFPKQKLFVNGQITTTKLSSWKQNQIKFKMKVVDFPPASCYILSGVHVLSFAGRVQRLQERGSFILLSSEETTLKVHIQTMKNPHHDIFSLCGLALRYEGVTVTINRCSESLWNKRFTLQYQGLQHNSRIKIFEARNGNLLTIYIHDLVHIRIDINSLDISASVHVSGFHSNKVEGLCGTIVRKKNKNAVSTVTDGYGVRVWRVQPHQSLFQTSPSYPYERIQASFPKCECSPTKSSNSCTEIKNKSEFYSFIYQKDITSEFYVTKKNPIITKTYNISAKSDIRDNRVSKPSEARQQCKEVIRDSDLFRKCVPLRGSILTDIVVICEKIAIVQEKSVWIPIVLRLMENVCNFAYTSNTSLSDRNVTSGIDQVTKIKDLFRCPEKCFEHGICTRGGCECFKGYSGVECLNKAVVPTNDGSSQSTEVRTVKPTSDEILTSTSPSEAQNANPTKAEEQTTKEQTTTSTTTTRITTTATTSTSRTTTTTTTKQTPTPTTTKITTTTVSPTTTTTLKTTSTARPTTLKSTTVSKQTTPAPASPPTTARRKIPMFVSCDTRSSGCNFVYLRIGRNQYPVSCRVTNVKFNNKKWIQRQQPMFVNIRYVTPTLAECLLNTSVTVPTDGDPVFKVEVLDAGNEVLSDKLFSKVNKQCQSCSYWRGCRIRRNFCVMDGKCYMHKDKNPSNKCEVCLVSSSRNQWTKSEVDNLPPILQRDPYEFSVVEGDTINSKIMAYDPEGSELTYKINSTKATVQQEGRFFYKTKVSSLGRDGYFEYFNISITDECDLQSSIIVKVAVNMCNCRNNGTCIAKDIAKPNQARVAECNCQHPFSGSLCERSPDFCATRPCFPGVQCTNLNTSYRCGRCPPGHAGNGAICKPSCSSSPCFENVTCTNDLYGEKGFRCGYCPRFYRGDGVRCNRTDLDACKYGVCPREGRCENIAQFPGYRCSSCPRGYQGDGIKCSAPCRMNCQNGGSCINGNKCSCKPGYGGVSCEKETCSVRCLNGGQCYNGNRCLCQKDYTGYYCQTPICNPPCQNNGMCARPGTCYCPFGYYGPTCERTMCFRRCRYLCQLNFKRSTCWTYCQNGGRCVFNSCLCSRGWTGIHCQIPKCEIGCMNGGTCVGTNQCRCQAGYWGSYCQHALCWPRCRYGGQCIKPNECKCQPNYSGRYCQIIRSSSRPS
ncbi:uncharacterized protein LOC134274281 isoform X2 [Saccostrea cucullata]|uniref:uncharacterized protein LOC134274281 isoform X2 n=1 Tax=Saccostrea cuccullata TaxID=36930 RepID=UPI002ED6B7FC